MPNLHQHLLLCAIFCLPTISSCGSRDMAERVAQAPSDDPRAQSGLARAGAEAPRVERQLVRTVSLELVVDDVARARARCEALAAGTAGFVQSLESNRYGASKHVQLTLRVPKDKLDGLLDALRALGAVQHESQVVEDVTRKHVDVDARLRNMTRTEERLLALLQNGQNALSDVLAVERELARVREDNEVLSAELRTLNEQIALCTVRLGLTQESDFEPPPSLWSPLARLWRNVGNIVVESFGALLAFVATTVTWSLYALPWTPLLFGAFLVVRRVRNRRKKTNTLAKPADVDPAP